MNLLTLPRWCLNLRKGKDNVYTRIQKQRITSKNCGSCLNVPFEVTNANQSILVGQYLVGRNHPLIKKEISELIGTFVSLRTLITCLVEGTGMYCSFCAGEEITNTLSECIDTQKGLILQTNEHEKITTWSRLSSKPKSTAVTEDKKRKYIIVNPRSIASSKDIKMVLPKG